MAAASARKRCARVMLEAHELGFAPGRTRIVRETRKNSATGCKSVCFCSKTFQVTRAIAALRSEARAAPGASQAPASLLRAGPRARLRSRIQRKLTRARARPLARRARPRARARLRPAAPSEGLLQLRRGTKLLAVLTSTRTRHRGKSQHGLVAALEGLQLGVGPEAMPSLLPFLLGNLQLVRSHSVRLESQAA